MPTKRTGRDCWPVVTWLHCICVLKSGSPSTASSNSPCSCGFWAWSTSAGVPHYLATSFRARSGPRLDTSRASLSATMRLSCLALGKQKVKVCTGESSRQRPQAHSTMCTPHQHVQRENLPISLVVVPLHHHHNVRFASSTDSSCKRLVQSWFGALLVGDFANRSHWANDY